MRWQAVRRHDYGVRLCKCKEYNRLRRWHFQEVIKEFEEFKSVATHLNPRGAAPEFDNKFLWLRTGASG